MDRTEGRKEGHLGIRDRRSLLSKTDIIPGPRWYILLGIIYLLSNWLSKGIPNVICS